MRVVRTAQTRSCSQFPVSVDSPLILHHFPPAPFSIPSLDDVTPVADVKRPPQVQHFDYWALKYGTLDEKHVGRDRTPDAAVGQLARGFVAFIVARLTGEFALAYRKEQAPMVNFSWTYPLRLFAWIIVMDLCFYSYHRFVILPVEWD